MNSTMLHSTTLFSACTVALLAVAANGQSLSDRVDGVARIQQTAAPAAGNASRAQLLGALLYTDITVDFAETPAREAINYLAQQMGVNIVARYSSDRNATSGIDADSLVTLKVEAQPALSVLENILSQVQEIEPNTWQLRDGFIEVGPKDRLDVAKETRFYPVRDLLFEPVRFDNAPTFDLQSAIEQGNTGGTGGGGGSGGGGGGGGFGGSGGGGGGSGGGGGGSGGGGGIFGSPGEEPERVTEAERAEELKEIIMDTIESERWTDNGGQAASIRYYQGVFIVRAPDYIQRQLGGYPFVARPVRGGANAAGVGRYVTFSTPISIIQNQGYGSTTVSGAAGGGTR